jgi:DNA-binding beta-propeller fold protein YncE
MWRLRLVLPWLFAVSCIEPAAQDTSPSPTGEDYALVGAWPRLPPGKALGRVYSVAVAPSGEIYVAHGADGQSANASPIVGDTIYVFDAKSGEFLRSFGGGLFRLPHAITFDATGHLWVTDSDAGEIVELDGRGVVVSRLGSP